MFTSDNVHQSLRIANTHPGFPLGHARDEIKGVIIRVVSVYLLGFAR